MAEFIIEDAYSVPGMGTVMTGEVTGGSIAKGMQTRVGNEEGVVTGLELSRKMVDEVNVGDNAGIMLSGIDADVLKVLAGSVIAFEDVV